MAGVGLLLAILSFMGRGKKEELALPFSGEIARVVMKIALPFKTVRVYSVHRLAEAAGLTAPSR